MRVFDKKQFYCDSFLNSSESINSKVRIDRTVTFDINSVNAGFDWVYSFVGNNYLYDVKYWIFTNMDSICNANFTLAVNIIWVWMYENNKHNLVWSIIYDIISNKFNLKFNRSICIREMLLANIYAPCAGIAHPEIAMVPDQVTFTMGYLISLSETTLTVLNDNVAETPSSIMGIFFHSILSGYCILMIIMVLFNFFNSSSKEENLIDQDYTTANVLVEAEEEISSWDDMIWTFSFIIILFGWYFYGNSINLFFDEPEFGLLVVNLFAFYLLLLIGPLILLNDFGVNFLAYLKGVGSSSSLVLELIYDFIAFLAFYMRVLVQAVRLLLIMFTYISLHDAIILAPYVYRGTNSSETFFDELSKVKPSISSVSYYLSITLPNRLGYWSYELLHTFFVVTAQFVAFFAMIFWLYFFLYTYFTLERQLLYVADKKEKRRLERVKILKNIYKTDLDKKI